MTCNMMKPMSDTFDGCNHCKTHECHSEMFKNPDLILIQMYYTERGEKPDSGTMIVADIGGEWEILMGDGEDTACAWEDDEPMRFNRWFYLPE